MTVLYQSGIYQLEIDNRVGACGFLLELRAHRSLQTVPSCGARACETSCACRFKADQLGVPGVNGTVLFILTMVCLFLRGKPCQNKFGSSHFS